MLTERMILYMTEKEFMSGSELRQYLHISTRKMKYLMDNNYIPHENTGHTTHKYRVRTEDAVRFKARMDTEPGFLSELSGMFSNRTEWHPLPMFEATPENCEAFRRWLSSQWAELPEALPTQTAAELVRLIGSPRLKVLYDIYHMQLNEGRLCDTIRQYADTFGHVHAADAPGRREPGTGEIAFPRVYKALEAAGYTGLVGYELFPARSTREAVKAILDAG